MRQVSFPSLILSDLGCACDISKMHVQLQVTELKPEWLVEIAPHYYQMKDVEDGKLSLSLQLIHSPQLIVCVSGHIYNSNMIFFIASNAHAYVLGKKNFCINFPCFMRRQIESKPRK